jgi:hypothetical protein
MDLASFLSRKWLTDSTDEAFCFVVLQRFLALKRPKKSDMFCCASEIN